MWGLYAILAWSNCLSKLKGDFKVHMIVKMTFCHTIYSGHIHIPPIAVFLLYTMPYFSSTTLYRLHSNSIVSSNLYWLPSIKLTWKQTDVTMTLSKSLHNQSFTASATTTHIYTTQMWHLVMINSYCSETCQDDKQTY